MVNREHERLLFSLGAAGEAVYSVGQDRCLVAASLESVRPTYVLPTFAGFVYCLASNPIEPGLVGVGAGDGVLRVWRPGDPAQLYSLQTHHSKQLSQAKVLSLAWHPSKEGLLAFGTDGGRVGWLDTARPGRQPSLSSYQHRSGVYCVLWARPDELLTCGDGRVVAHSMAAGTGKEQMVGAGRAGASQILLAERGDRKLLLVGREDGSVEVWHQQSDPILLLTLKSQSKLIQSLALHPQFMADGSESQYSLYLASASNEFPVHVFDLGPALERSEGAGPEILVSPTTTLTGHLQRVIEVAWSPHIPARLVSVSYDFSAQVWDAAKGTPLHNYGGHAGRVMCCLWHPARPGLVITGGEDGCIQVILGFKLILPIKALVPILLILKTQL